MQDIYLYLDKVGINKKESDIFVKLWELGTKPASTIAQLSGYERVYTYKVLQKFVEMGIIAETVQGGVKQFWIPGLDGLRGYIKRQESDRNKLDDQFDLFASQVAQLTQNKTYAPPKIQMYEQSTGIKSLCQDMLSSIQRQKLITVKLFATNTFEEQLMSRETTRGYLKHFLQEINDSGISN